MTDQEREADLVAHIGSTLRRCRERHRLTQTELAGRVAASQATVARIERGERAPSVAMLQRLFGVLGWQGPVRGVAGEHRGAAR